MNNIVITWKGFKLPLHQASVYYLGGVDPSLQWEVRGISGHSSGKDPAKKERLNEQIKNITVKLKDVVVEPFQAREIELAGELTMDEIESTMATVRER